MNRAPMSPPPAVPWPRTAAVIGAGGVVGAATTAALVRWGAAERVLAVDRHRALALSQVIDIGESRCLSRQRTSALDVAELDDLRDIDLLIVAASVRETATGDRRSFVDANVELLRELAPAIERATSHGGLVLLVTNPVDVLAHVLTRVTAIPRHRVIGYSLNDSLRFRAALAVELHIPASAIDAWVLGEHGAHQVPLFSRVRIDRRRAVVPPDVRARVATTISEWFHRWSALNVNRSTGWTTSAGILALCRRIAARTTMPACVATDGAYGLPDTFVTVPAMLDPSGVRCRRDWRLAGDEQAALIAAGASVASAATTALTRAGRRVRPA